ncbi:CGNR zinc finger domain-containing protein [Roseobacter sp. YSTF-M11]|uniref:CGNR zinc finger domain-containing protein n=1 Tax=Roseobacter insulae TaxID=2859783 RepID=A0A9X1FT84_9RHOB|nr:ABATE domain-containing protein [Roseobacter insulae]MBW4707253.1 CGNR zinc finger domain-containing protein [Roseobacter insulae]
MTREFEFVAGSLSLNLIDTVATRTNAPTELLAVPAQFERWVNAAGFEQAVRIDADRLAKARGLREAAHGVLAAVLAGDTPPASAINELNDWARLPGLRAQFVDGKVVMTSADPFEAVLATIAQDALLLLSADKRDRLRRCPGCDMLFFDQSRPGKRRWCSSASGCGNRAKVRRHRQRHKLQDSS